MPRDTTWRPTAGPRPALWYYDRDVSVPRVMWNWTMQALAKVAPWFPLKNALLRLTGMTIGDGVALGYAVQPDLLFPQDITIEDDATVGYNTTILCHGYLRDRYERGHVHIERDACIGADCTILAGVRVGAGAVVGAHSLINKDIPAGEFWAGVPARRLGTVAERFPDLASDTDDPT